MIKATRAFCLACMLLFISGIARGQSFSYTASASTGTYAPISGTAIADTTLNWIRDTYILPIGFDFGFNGEVFDTLSIEPNGIIKFDPRHAIVAYHGSGCKQDTSDIYSRLSYSLSGTSGSQVLKIQYTYCGYDIRDSLEYISYQVWLYEQDNKIEIHTGPNSYPGSSAGANTIVTPLMGLINPLQDTSINGLLLTGDANTPGSSAVSYGNTLLYLDFVPPSGKVYTFTPSGN